MKFSIRDLIWLTLVAACLTVWWLAKRENTALRDANAALRDDVSVALGKNAQTVEMMAKQEKVLRKEVELLNQLVRRREKELSKREADLRDSLDKREAMVKALRIIQETPTPPN